jgi:hypothetical protein
VRGTSRAIVSTDHLNVRQPCMRTLRIIGLVLAICSTAWSLIPTFCGLGYIIVWSGGGGIAERFLGLSGVFSVCIGAAHIIPMRLFKGFASLSMFAACSVIVALIERFTNAKAHTLGAGFIFEDSGPVPLRTVWMWCILPISRALVRSIILSLDANLPNQSTDPTLSSGTPLAGPESRHP